MSPNTVRLQEWVQSKLRSGGSSSCTGRGTTAISTTTTTTTFVSVDALDAGNCKRPALTPAEATQLLAEALLRSGATHPEERESVYDCGDCSPCMKGCLLWASGNRRRYFLIAVPRAFRHFGTGDCFPPLRAVEEPLRPGAGDDIRREMSRSVQSFMYVFTAAMVKECIAREIMQKSACMSSSSRHDRHHSSGFYRV